MIRDEDRLSKILDRAEPCWWIPVVAALNLGMGTGMVQYGGGAGWIYIAFGIILILIHPAGTRLRRRYRIRKFRRELEGSRHLDVIREWRGE